VDPAETRSYLFDIKINIFFMNLYKEEHSVFDYIKISLENLPDAENVIPDP
jgi:hypothetical protein